MKFCTQCGQQNNDNAAFCTGCAQPLGQAAPPPPPINQGYAPPPMQQPNYAPSGGGLVSPKSKAVTLLLFLFVHIGLPYFYIGNTRKGTIYLLLYWPTMVVGWILFFLILGIPILLFNLVLLTLAVVDVIKLFKGELLDGNKLPIVK